MPIASKDKSLFKEVFQFYSCNVFHFLFFFFLVLLHFFYQLFILSLLPKQYFNLFVSLFNFLCWHLFQAFSICHSFLIKLEGPLSYKYILILCMSLYIIKSYLLDLNVYHIFFNNIYLIFLYCTKGAFMLNF